MSDNLDEYLSEIEKRNKESISKKTGYVFREERTENASDWRFYMDAGSLQDPEGFSKYEKNLSRKLKRNYEKEGDGWLTFNWKDS